MNDKWFCNGYEENFFNLPEKFDTKKMIYLGPNGKKPLEKLGNILLTCTFITLITR